MAALAAAGGAPRFIGGCVRNMLLELPIGDIDIATPLPPEAVAGALEAEGLRWVGTGLAHGTVTALVPADGRTVPFEITTLRVDVETDGRRARVAFTDDWTADAARRDFTLNALSLSLDGDLFDPFGGEADARAGRIRFVGDPDQRLEEDALRLLRFFRMLAHYGRQPPDPVALAACRTHGPRLDGLSGERIRQELLKLLAAADPSPAWGWMIDTGVAARVIGRDGDAATLAGLIAVEARTGTPAAALRRLAALLTGATASDIALLADRLRFSRREWQELAALCDPAAAIAAPLTVPALQRHLYRLGAPAERGADLVLLTWAAAPDDERFLPLWHAARAWVRPRFPLTGADALAAGVPAGPSVGTALRALEAWWMTQDFAPDRAACLTELRRRAGPDA